MELGKLTSSELNSKETPKFKEGYDYCLLVVTPEKTGDLYYFNHNESDDIRYKIDQNEIKLYPGSVLLVLNEKLDINKIPNFNIPVGAKPTPQMKKNIDEQKKQFEFENKIHNEVYGFDTTYDEGYTRVDVAKLLNKYQNINVAKVYEILEGCETTLINNEIVYFMNDVELAVLQGHKN